MFAFVNLTATDIRIGFVEIPQCSQNKGIQALIAVPPLRSVKCSEHKILVRYRDTAQIDGANVMAGTLIVNSIGSI